MKALSDKPTVEKLQKEIEKLKEELEKADEKYAALLKQINEEASS